MKNLHHIMMVLLGGAMYGTMSSFVKLFYTYGFNAAELSFSQALFSAIFLGLIWIFSGKKDRITRKDLISLLITGGTIGLTNYLYYQSVSYISASLAIVILMQFTWLCLLIEWALFRRKPTGVELLTVIFILLGTVLAGDLFHVNTASFSWTGIALALGSSVTYAVYIVANSRIGKQVNWLPKSTLIMLGSALMIWSVNARTIVMDNHLGYEFFLIALFLALFGTAIPTALFAYGIPKIGAGISSILMTIELPVAILCAGLILNEHISPLQAGGIATMLIAIVAMNYYRSLKNK